MNITPNQPGTDTDHTDTQPTTSHSSTTPTPEERESAIFLDDPRGVGFTVQLPKPTGDPQLAVDAIYQHTPFTPYAKDVDEPTTYDSLTTFLNQHPNGDTMRPIVNSHFAQSD